MKIYALICHKLDLTQFWPKVVSWRFEITTDDMIAKILFQDLTEHHITRYFIPVTIENRTCDISSATIGTLFLCCVRV